MCDDNVRGIIVEIIKFIILNIVLLMCIYTDWKCHKIYNWVVFPAIVFGFVWNTAVYGYEGFISSSISFGISLVFFLIFYLVHMMGAGDVKLIVACSVITNVFYAAGGLIIGTILAAFYGSYVWVKTKKRRIRIPYGIFIGIGFFLYQLMILLFM